MATYATGGVNTATDHNFVSYYDGHKPDIQDTLVQRYMNSIIGFLDFTNSKKGTDALEFSRFEKDREMPKIKATTAGAGAGLQASFTIDASSKVAVPSAAPYTVGATPAGAFSPVRLNDLIMVKPGSGTVSYGTYIYLIVDGLTSNTSFTATPLLSTAVTPAIASADEIIIVGNAHGEGSVFNTPLSTKATKYTEKLQIIKHRMRVTGSEALVKRWFTDPRTGNEKFAVRGEGDAYAQFVNFVDLNLLVGIELSNSTIANTFQAAGTPLALTRGLLSTINDGGNILNYSGISGLVIEDIYDYNVEIDANKAQKRNLLFAGIQLDQQIDRELGDRLKDGAVSYGSFNMDQEKAVNLSFQKMKIGGYTYDKRCMESFNDAQTLGADGYGFPYEGFTIPAGSVKIEGGAERGSSVPSLRKRFLEGEGKSREMHVSYFNGLTDSSNGDDFEEVRYLAQVALEAQAINQYGYIKKA